MLHVAYDRIENTKSAKSVDDLAFKNIVRSIKHINAELVAAKKAPQLKSWFIKCLVRGVFTPTLAKKELKDAVLTTLIAIAKNTSGTIFEANRFYEADGKTPLFKSENSQLSLQHTHTFANLAIKYIRSVMRRPQ